MIDRPAPVNYSSQVLEVRQTLEYRKWFQKLRDKQAKARIDIRIRRISLGNFGDVKSVGHGVSELRLPYGPGYRIYFARRGETIVLLLCGGSKATQGRDIELAYKLAKEL